MTGKALNITLWVVQVLLTGMFLLAGANKLDGNPQMVALFDTIGVGQWFRYVTGSLEVLGAALLLIPRINGAGAALLVPVMVGAVSTHFVILHNSPAIALVLLAALLFVAWGRRGQLASLARRLRGQ